MTTNMEKGGNFFFGTLKHVLQGGQYVLLIAECILNKSDIIMRLTVWHERANLA